MPHDIVYLRLNYRKKVSTSNLFASIALLILYVTHSASRTSECLKVRLSHDGILVGRHLISHSGRHIRGFLGVPYAEPPIGELRFKPPIPASPWIGEKFAVQDSPICTQRNPFVHNATIEGKEDCLYLNVYTPEQPFVSSPLPVMVWFHGGAWMCGAGTSSFYGPDYFMDHDVILVAVNFRLGALGFLSTGTTDCPGNFGLKDQVAALKWVQQNIAAFGGDPNKVTIFGESAGGASVAYHMLSDQSKGLFQKGILQSGTYFNSWAQPAHKGVAEERALELAEMLDCYSGTEGWLPMLKCLREARARDIIDTSHEFFEWDIDPMIPFPPVVEPPHSEAFLTHLPREVKQPHGLKLPILIGANADEGLFKTASLLNQPELLEDFRTNFHKVLPIVLNYDHHAAEVQKEITNAIEKYYFKDGHNYNKADHQNLTDLFSDGWFFSGIDEYLRRRMEELNTDADSTGNTFVYLFKHKGAASFSELFRGSTEDYHGVCHADELIYLFPVRHQLFATAAPTQSDIALREAMVQMWVNFASFSNPTPAHSNLPTWHQAKEYPVSCAQLGNIEGVTDGQPLRNLKGFPQARLDFWHQLRPHVPAQEYKPLNHDEL